MKKTIKRTTASLMSLLLLVCLCSCGIQQYGIPRLPEAQTSATETKDQEAEVMNAFYTDQTMSMEGFCGKKGYKTTLNEVRSLLAEDVLHKHDIYRYDVIVDQIGESVFIQNYHNNKLNYLHYYSKDGIASSNTIKNKEKAEAKGNVKPLEMALKHAFETDRYKDGLCVFTTDGYEQNRNYSVMFAPLAENVFKRGNAVAFIGVRSDFNGTVWLATGNPKDNYKWPDPRMFYLIVTGPTEKVVKFSSDLSERLTAKKIENYTSTFLPPDKTMSVIEESLKLESEDDEAVSMSDVAPGKSFLAWDMTDNVIKEEGQDYYPTFSASLGKNSKAMTTFTAATELMNGVKVPPVQVKTVIMSYNGLIETDEPEEEEGKNAVKTVSGEPDQGRAAQGEKNDTEDAVLRAFNLNVRPASYDLKDSIVVKSSFAKNGKLQIRTVFKDTSLLKNEGDILVKYSVCIGDITETPKWVLDNSASGLLTKEEKAKTLDLRYVYEGLKQSCNATMDNGELFTFYCYYSVN